MKSNFELLTNKRAKNVMKTIGAKMDAISKTQKLKSAKIKWLTGPKDALSLEAYHF